MKPELGVDDPLRGYLDGVRGILTDVPGYVATVVVGSLASNDFSLDHSDIDLIPLYEAPLKRDAKTGITSRLRHRVLPCPAHGLDLVAYTMREVREPSRTPELDFAISTGPDWEDHVSLGERYPGGLIDLAAARQFGSTLEGIAVSTLIGHVDSSWVADELGGSLRWHLDKIHDPFHDPLGSNAVLNACRALHFLRSGSLVSKAQGAAEFLDGVHGHLVERALQARRSTSARPLPKEEVLAFVREAAKEFEGRAR